MKFPLVASATAAVIITALSGCASSQTETGIRIGDETLKQFEAGVTTRAWLVAVLGPPTSEAPVEGIPNTFVYRYSTGSRASGLSSLLTGGGSATSATTYFIITDNVVTRYWADREVQYTALGKAVEQPSGEKQAE
jgi:hypothetical protein